MKKLMALISTAGKSKEQIVKEMDTAIKKYAAVSSAVKAKMKKKKK